MNRSGSYLLDTNIVIALFAGDRAVETKVRNTADVALAPLIIGELCFGAQKSQKVTENLHRINMFIAIPSPNNSWINRVVVLKL